MVKKNFKRTIKLKYIFLIFKKKVIKVNYRKFLKNYKVHDIIKFQKNEFKFIKLKKILTHFNIKDTVHKKGKKYIIAKIYRKGYYNGKIYNHPILDSKKFFLCLCLQAKNNLSYKILKKSDFKYSIKTIKNIKQLKSSILKRYKYSLGNVNNQNKLKMGIALTKLKILKTTNIKTFF